MKDDSELETLTQAYIDGSLSGDAAERLNSILAGSEEARLRFSEALNLDSAIAATAAGWQLDASDTPPTRRKLVSWFALAACALILIGGACVWQLASHTTVGVESTQRLHVMKGRLAADVPPAAKGFTVITPSGDAIDLGTRFGVDVPENGPAEIHVFEGEVIAKTSGTAEELSLRAGDALSMDRGASSARDLRSSAFIQPNELGELEAAQGVGQRARSNAALEKLRNDPAKIAVLDFESGAEFPGIYRPVQGRWPGSRAPEFIHAGDHLKLDVGGEQTWPQLTLAAWVRLDQLGALYQSLLHADGWEGDNFGLVHWMVNEATTIRHVGQ